MLIISILYFKESWFSLNQQLQRENAELGIYLLIMYIIKYVFHLPILVLINFIEILGKELVNTKIKLADTMSQLQ